MGKLSCRDNGYCCIVAQPRHPCALTGCSFFLSEACNLKINFGQIVNHEGNAKQFLAVNIILFLDCNLLL